MSTQRGRVTISTVARHAGRSISTVSAALNGAPGVAAATREEILRIATELGYEADPRARLMRAAHTGIIGVSYFPGQAFQAELVDALYCAADRHGHGLSLAASTPRHGEAEGIAALVRDRCEGIIVVDSRVPYEELRRAAGDLPLLMLCRESPAKDVSAVRSQDEEAIAGLVAHIADTGRRQVTYVDGGAAISSALRVHAFEEAAALHGLDGRVVRGGDTEEAGIAATAALIDSDTVPQAMLFYNDHAALGGLLELRRRGIRVPQDVAVAGFDGIALSGLPAVDLTSVRQDVDTIAEVALVHLVSRLACSGQQSQDESESGSPTRSFTGHCALISDADCPAWQGVVAQDLGEGGLRLTVPASLLIRSSTSALY